MEEGKVKSYIAIRTDITQKKKNEEELIDAKEYAEETAKAKSEFLANMSHEIRTPMNGVIGMLNLLSHTKLDETQEHQVHLATSSANALLTLINDILDFSKIEAGKLELEKIDFDLRNHLGDFAETMSFSAQEKGVEIVLDLKNVGETVIKSDPGRLRQLLTNLVGNAVKFTSNGTILISASIDTSKEDDVRLIVSVQDSGIGIPKEKIDILFDSFSQVDASTTRQYGGTGLGLAIVKILSELMDGSIKVQSELGEGSTFTFNIGVEIGTSSLIMMPDVDIKGKRILIVDDNEVNQEVLKGQLELWGMEVDCAYDAKEALEMCEIALERGLPSAYDIAFLDMQMPEMDGAELGTILRKEKAYDAMKLVMMTSLGFKTDAKEFAEIGFNTFFPKPATTKDILQALHVLVDNGEAMNGAKPLITSDYLSSLKKEEEQNNIIPTDSKILLVEDNKTNQLVALGFLDNFDLDADIANNSGEAIDILKATTVPSDIILMDCQMPEMDGYETTENIRCSKAGDIHKDTLIVAMTANAMQGDKDKCLASGMNDYLAKPINIEQFNEMLRKYLLLKK